MLAPDLPDVRQSGEVFTPSGTAIPIDGLFDSWNMYLWAGEFNFYRNAIDGLADDDVVLSGWHKFKRFIKLLRFTVNTASAGDECADAPAERGCTSS